MKIQSKATFKLSLMVTYKKTFDWMQQNNYYSPSKE
jgi:hypothetical protein